MIDITNTEISIGDLLICTDYSSTCLYYGVVTKISKASVIIRQTLVDVTEEEIKTGKLGYEIRKSSNSHMFIVRDERSIAALSIGVYSDEEDGNGELVRETTVGELIQAVRNHVR